MTQEAETGHVRTGVHAHAHHALARIFVERLHRVHRLFEHAVAKLSVFPENAARGLKHRVHLLRHVGDDAGADFFRQNELIAGFRSLVRYHLSGVDGSRDGDTVFGFHVVHAVAAHDDAARLAHLVRAAGQDSPQNVQTDMAGEPHQVQPGDRLRAHGEAIAQRVGRGYLAIGVRVVHDGGEEIHRLDDGQILPEPIHARVVPGVRSVEQVRVRKRLKLAQSLSQVLRTQFRASPARLDHPGKLNFSLRCSRHFFASKPRRGLGKFPSGGIIIHLQTIDKKLLSFPRFQ